MSTENTVVAGVDESAQSWAAAQWAATEAERRHASLRVVHAYTIPVYGLGTAIIPTGLAVEVEQIAANVLERAAASVRSAHPGLQVQTTLAARSAAGALLAAGENALLTVVGARGVHHELTDVLLGSVAARVAEHSHSPVVVVRRPPGTAGHDSGRPVVVGLDGAPDSDAALAFAMDEAALRRVRLIAVHTWDDRALIAFGRVYPLEIDTRAVHDEEVRLLAEQLAGWDQKYPDVEVERVVTQGPAGPALIEVGRTAQACLVVVGSRGHTAATSLFIGSTSRRVLAHATAPVAVVRASR